MNLIVGLGNPGQEYKSTRHNFGFIVLDKLSDKRSLKFKTVTELNSQITRKNNLCLVKPLTFVNSSGLAVKNVLEKFNCTKEELLVVCDDFSLPLGTMRLKLKGSSGGHNGLESIITTLETNQFARLRLGIGPLPKNIVQKDFVLSDFGKEEKKIVDKVRDQAVFVIEKILETSIEKTIEFANTICIS